MPTFETPQPIAVTVDVFLGHVEIIASDRTDTVVEVRPSDPAKKERRARRPGHRGRFRRPAT